MCIINIAYVSADPCLLRRAIAPLAYRSRKLKSTRAIFRSRQPQPVQQPDVIFDHFSVCSYHKNQRLFGKITWWKRGTLYTMLLSSMKSQRQVNVGARVYACFLRFHAREINSRNLVSILRILSCSACKLFSGFPALRQCDTFQRKRNKLIKIKSNVSYFIVH